MIRSISLSNFQSHSDTTVTFCAGVNAIEGKTDSGKSAIIRGLCLALENKPSGTSFIRNGTDNASSEIVLAPIGADTAEHTVKRFRSNSKNQYVVDGTVLSAVGRGGVPDEVSALTGIDASVNIQKQSAPYFLLHNTESERGKLLEGFCNIRVAAQAVVIARRYALHWSKQANVCREELKPVQSKLEALEGLPALELAYAEIEQLQSKLLGIDNRISAITDLATKLSAVSTKLAEAKPLVAMVLKQIEDIAAIRAKLLPIIEKGTALVGFQKEVSKAIPSFIVIPNAPDIAAVTAKLTPLESFKEALSHPIPARVEIPIFAVTRISAIAESIEALVRIAEQDNSITAKLTSCITELETVNNELKQWDSCPLCGQRISNGNIHVE